MEPKGGPIEAQRVVVKKARNTLKHVIRRAKKESFRSLAKEADSMPAMAKLNKILDRKQSHPLGFIRGANGVCTTSTRDTLDVMIREHFPGSRQIAELGDDRDYQDPPRPIESCNWIN